MKVLKAKKGKTEDDDDRFCINEEDETTIRTNPFLRMLHPKNSVTQGNQSNPFVRDWVECKKIMKHIGVQFSGKKQVEEKYIIAVNL